MRWSRSRAETLARPELAAEGMDPTAYEYRYHARFDTGLLQPMDACRGEIPYEGPAQWVAWLDAEAAYWVAEGKPKDYTALATWWLADPSQRPIVAVRQADGTACVVDGAHRTAIAHAHHRKTVPVVLAMPKRSKNSIEVYWSRAPTEAIDVPWAEELLNDLAPAMGDPQVRLLVDAETLALLERLATAPRRRKYFERVGRSGIRPVEYAGAEEGWYLDDRSGRKVVLEDDGQWFRETSYPPGAVTIGELVRLEWLLWLAAENAAKIAEEGLLDRRQRKSALALVEAADHLALRLKVEQLHPDPEKAEEIKRSVLETIAREPNRKKFVDRPHKWKEVLVSVPGLKLTRGQIRDLYMADADRIVDAMRGYDALVLIGIGENKTILRRHGPDGKNIRITKVGGIEDPNSLEYWANRRLLELHRVVGSKTDVVWVDLDPKGDGPLRQMALDIVPRIEAIVRSVYPLATIVSWDSGKRGVHVEGYLPRKVSTDAARRKLRIALDREFAGDPLFTTGVAKPGQVRLDVTTLKRTGSVRAPWTPTVEGRVKRPLADL